jgi:hypothetical protein
MTSADAQDLERHAMAAIRMLVAAGFLAIPVGDPDDLHMLLFFRDRLDIRDMVKVYGADECEAARIVARQLVKEASGSTPDVVRAVLDWPHIVTASGRDHR